MLDGIPEFMPENARFSFGHRFELKQAQDCRQQQAQGFVLVTVPALLGLMIEPSDCVLSVHGPGSARGGASRSLAATFLAACRPTRKLSGSPVTVRA